MAGGEGGKSAIKTSSYQEANKPLSLPTSPSLFFFFPLISKGGPAGLLIILLFLELQ